MRSLITKKYNRKNKIQMFIINFILLQIAFGSILICPILKNAYAYNENILNNNNINIYTNNKIDISSRQYRLRNNNSDNWYNNNWTYRRKIIIDNSQNENNLTNYQVKIKITPNNFNYSHASLTGDDIIFTDSDGITSIDYWIEEWNNSNTGTIWVKIPSIPASSNKIIYMYYGNENTNSTGSAEKTFSVFDGFESEFEGDCANRCGVWYESPVPGVYHGPMATYCMWHRPMAIYVPSQNKTFFVYSNYYNSPTISYYDHTLGVFADPVPVGTNPDGDAHRNPTILIDEEGYIYIFWGAHGHSTHVVKSSYIYDITCWDPTIDIGKTSTYPQPWQLKSGELFVSCREGSGRWRYRKSTNGAQSWSPPVDLIDFGSTIRGCGIYLVSIAETGSYPRKIHMAWSYYVNSWDQRWDVYYAYSDDGGTTWKKSDDTQYTLPITPDSAEKIYESGDRGVWLKDIQLDSNGNPFILFISANRTTFQSTWKIVRQSEVGWEIKDLTTSDHMYDAGALVILADNDMRIYAPTTESQDGEDGGEIDEWRSIDKGETWILTKHITSNSLYSHNQIRTVWNHQKGDFRIFWCYGDSLQTAPDKSVTLYYYGEDQSHPKTIFNCNSVPHITWARNTGGGMIELSQNEKKRGNFSFKLNERNSSSPISLTTTLMPKAKGVVGAWMRIEKVGYFSLYAYSESILQAVIGFGANGYFRYWNGTEHSTNESYSINTWYLLTIEFDAAEGQYNFVVYDADLNEISRVNDISFTNGTCTALNKFMFYTSIKSKLTAYVDDFRYHEYNSPEPSTSVDSETSLSQAYNTSSSSGNNQFQTYFRDLDGDSYGDPNVKIISYVTLAGCVLNGLDCDDNDPNTYCSAPEIKDGKDNDCDGVIPTDELDLDNDGFMPCENDCDDSDPDIYPGATELADGKDNDCDGTVDEGSGLATYDTFTFTKTDKFMFVYGEALINDTPVEPGDWITVFTSAVTANNGCIGATEVTDTGKFSVVVFGDDTTTDEKDGASLGDTLTFKVWDKSSGEIIDIYPIGPDETKWHGANEALNINLITGPGQKIYLAEGWNLISIQVAKCFYEKQIPQLSIIDSNSIAKIEFEEKGSLKEWFLDTKNSPIRDEADPSKAGNWQRITSFDEESAYILDKDLPDFVNTLYYISIGYGYWVKMNEPGFLILKRQAVDTHICLNLNEGWNLVGFIPANICYADINTPKEELCPYKLETGMFQPEEEIIYCPSDQFPEFILTGISGKYRRICSFDTCSGAMIYDTELPSFINTLNYLAPKYGFWIKMLENASLTFPGCDSPGP